MFLEYVRHSDCKIRKTDMTACVACHCDNEMDPQRRRLLFCHQRGGGSADQSRISPYQYLADARLLIGDDGKTT